MGAMYITTLPLRSLLSALYGYYNKKKELTANAMSSKIKSWRLPTLPGGHPPSTIGVEGLNYSVRNGKRWNTLAIVTMD
jgi:hypothetical protein